MPRMVLIEDENGFIESLFTEDGNQGFMLNTTIGGSWFTVPVSVQWVARCILEGLGDAVDDVEPLCRAKSTTKSSRSVWDWKMCVSRLHSTAPGRLASGTSKAMRAVAPMTRRSTLIPTRCTTMDRVTTMSWAARTWKHAITTLRPPWTMDRAWFWTSVASVAVMAFLQEHVTVMATSWTNAACVVGQVRFMSAVARTFLRGSAIATATC